MLQHRAVRFIARLTGRESVTEACSELGLQPLKKRRRNHRLSLLMKILQNEKRHSTLSIAYDESPEVTMTTRSAARGEMTYTIVASYYEPSEITEEILINKQNTKIDSKQNILKKYYQSTTDCCNPCTHKNYSTLLLAK